MHCSGTSAIAGVLSDLGFHLGDELIPGDAGINERGFFEDRRVLDMHEDVLAAGDWSWDLPLPMTDVALERMRDAGARERIVEQIARLERQPGWAVKDPRLSLLLPLWREALESLDLSARVIICCRDPVEVASSLNRRDQMPEGRGFMLWCHYMLAAERASRDLDRLIVHFSDLMTDPHAVIANLVEWLDWKPDGDAMQQSARGVQPSQWHERRPSLTLACPAEAERIHAAFGRGVAHGAFDAVTRELAEASRPLESMIRDQHMAVRAWQTKLGAQADGFSDAVRQLESGEAAVASYARALEEQERGFSDALRQIEKSNTAVRSYAEALQAQEEGFRQSVEMVRERDAEIALLKENLSRAEGALRLVEADSLESSNSVAATYRGRIDFLVENNSHSRVARYMRETAPRGGRVLEIGCAGGYFGRAVRDLGYEVWGIESDSSVVHEAARRLDRVYEGTVEHFLDQLDGEETQFKFIVFGDVLEHLMDPVSVLRACVPHLTDDGHVIASVPNVAHASVRLMLLEGRWDYDEVGIIDSTHLRFYTRDNLVDLFTRAGFAVERLSAITLEKPDVGITVNPRIADAFNAHIRDRERDAFQFVAMAAPDDAASAERRNVKFMLRASHRILCLPPVPDSSLFSIRLEDPLQRLVQLYGGEVRVGDQHHPEPGDVAWCDMVILQREASPAALDLVRSLRARGKRVIFDIDDYLLDVPPYLTVYEHCERMRPHLEAVLAEVDAVSVSTPPLREALLSYNPRTYITPNYAWSNHAPIEHDDGTPSTPAEVRLIVASSDSVRVDFLVDVLRHLTDHPGTHVELVAIGPPGEYLRGVGIPVAALPTVSHEEFKGMLASRANTIALVPLDDNPFNRCKSAIKYFDYALAGVPAICSNMTPYANVIEHGVDGFLCGNSSVEWIEIASELIGNAGMRREVAATAHRRCLDLYSLNRSAAAWQEMLVDTTFPKGDPGEWQLDVTHRMRWQLLRGTIRHLGRPNSYRTAWKLYREKGVRGLVSQWKTVF
ncbi:MAG: methyltransferase domain-containing protein [Pseudomonadales bacterium]|jgi:2-polyprenyl-3-methyl-5-hydroxy-6-metoxy-1,4-benzoquinol methylase/glycosyltransferase involved in cell wall biosynthesis|nr:methyltransferase domain-containing protein [Pseudomonadales bacterium]